MRLMAFLFLLIVSAPAFAQTVEQEFCTAVAKHQTGGADYVPGVDVHGNAVAGADLNSGMQPILDPIVLPIEIDIAERFGFELPEGMAMKPEVAHVKIYGDGRVEYNDTDVTQNTAALCSSAKVTEPPYNPNPQDPSPVSSAVEEEASPRMPAPDGEAAPVMQIEREAVPEASSQNMGNGQGAPSPVISPSEYGPVIEGESE